MRLRDRHRNGVASFGEMRTQPSEVSGPAASVPIMPFLYYCRRGGRFLVFFVLADPSSPRCVPLRFGAFLYLCQLFLMCYVKCLSHTKRKVYATTMETLPKSVAYKTIDRGLRKSLGDFVKFSMGLNSRSRELLNGATHYG